jgi:ATP-dependent Clp protease ATP-binding subunit ClpB
VLAEAVRRKPFSIVLFDEVEKAHRDVWNVFLQIFDDGRLTDGKGRTVDFCNTVIIMTSNIGAHRLLEAATGGDGGDGDDAAFRAAHDDVQRELKRHFAPELLNRIDETVIFNPLSRESLRTIVEIEAKSLEQRLEERNIALDIDADAPDLIVDEAYQPAFGARPICRYIERVVATELSRMIIAGALPNNAKACVSADNGKLRFTAVQEANLSKRRRRRTNSLSPERRASSSSD